MHPVPPPVDVVAVPVYVPSVYPDPVPETVSPVTSPNDLTAAELLFCITFCRIRNFPASKLPENVAVPVVVSNLNTSVVPSSTMKSTFVPPLNVKSPPPLVSNVIGISISVPSVSIVVLLFTERLAEEVPMFNLGVALSTLKKGLEEPRVELTWNPVVSKPNVESNLIDSVPPIVTPI